MKNHINKIFMFGGCILAALPALSYSSAYDSLKREAPEAAMETPQANPTLLPPQNITCVKTENGTTTRFLLQILKHEDSEGYTADLLVNEKSVLTLGHEYPLTCAFGGDFRVFKCRGGSRMTPENASSKKITTESIASSRGGEKKEQTIDVQLYRGGPRQALATEEVISFAFEDCSVH